MFVLPRIIKSKDASTEIKVKLSGKDTLSIEDLLKQCSFPSSFVIKPVYISKNCIHYLKPNNCSISEFCVSSISIADVFNIICNYLSNIKALCGEGLLDECLVKNTDYAFINRKSLEIQMIYIPLVKPNETIDSLSFIKRIVNSVHLNNPSDRIILQNFIDFLNTQVRFNAGNIEKFIKNCVFFSSGKNVSHKDDDDDTEMTEKATQMTDDDPTLMDEDNVMLSFSAYDEDDEPTVLEDEKTEFFDDSFLSEERNTDIIYPVLKRLSTSEDIYINKPVFRIGKDRNVADYFVDNPAVSRNHADIMTKDNRYYIVDLKSKNKTYINGSAIPINVESEIHNDDLLTLADEEFIFKC